MQTTDVSMALPSAFTKPAGSSDRNAQHGGHHGWLRDLEKAQAAMRHLETATRTDSGPDGRVEEGRSSVDAIAPNVAQAELPVPWGADGVSVQDSAMTGVRAESASPAVVSSSVIDMEERPFTTGSPLVQSFKLPEGSAVGKSAEASAAYALAEQARYATSAISLMSMNGKFCSVSVRDASMTLGSELQLAQLLRSGLRNVGLEMGQLWFNGRAVYGENSGGDQ
ncbi:MAG: hypothetical protein QM776_13485 [Rhodocyclaceae bacterium]